MWFVSIFVNGMLCYSWAPGQFNVPILVFVLFQITIRLNFFYFNLTTHFIRKFV
jgi:hypothetical protein